MRERMRACAFGAAIALLGMHLWSGEVRAIEPGKPSTISYTSAQAGEGQTLYAAHCASCHGGGLQGGAGLPLTGPQFAARWNGRVLENLTTLVSTQMPLLAPHSLSTKDYLDIVAFILARNGYKSADAPLTLASGILATLDLKGGENARSAPGPMPILPGAPLYYGKGASAAPTEQDLLDASSSDWLMYNRDYRSQRYSALTQINKNNAGKLQAVCVAQLGQTGWYEASPVVYNGVLYTTVGDNTYAFDAATCRKKWVYDFLAAQTPVIVVNRGVALYKGALYRSTPAGHLIAIDAITGRPLWDTWVANPAQGYWLSAAPIAYDGKIFIGEAGADFGAPGHVYAFDAATGKHLWTFDLIATGSVKGAETWGGGSAHGGGSTWSSYTIDPQKGLLYVPVGNPAPDYNPAPRPGANLFTDSVVALDEKTGKLVWYAQQVAHDTHDWDTVAPPVVYDIGAKHFMAATNKGGWLYLYDRDRRTLLAQPEVSTHENADVPVTKGGVHACPGNAGGVEWYGPAFSPSERALFVNSVEWCGVYTSAKPQFEPASLYNAGDFAFDPIEKAGGWLRSFDAVSGKEIWHVKTATPMLAGVTPTAGGIVMTGDLNGDFEVFDSKRGTLLYRFNTGGAIAGGVSTYLVNDKQYVAVAAGNASRAVWRTTGSPTIFVFALPGG